MTKIQGAIDTEGRCRHWHTPVSYTHLRAHETEADLVCRLPKSAVWTLSLIHI